MKERLFYLVDANVAVPLRNPFKVQKKFMETTNFVPETLPGSYNDSVLMNPNGMVAKGETWMPDLDFLMENDSKSRVNSPFSPSETILRLVDDDGVDEDEDEDDWDDEDEDFDDEDEEEDWDEDEEDWDEDEDWDEEEEDEDWEDEDEEE